MALINKDKKDKIQNAIKSGDTSVVPGSIKKALPVVEPAAVEKEKKTVPPVQTGPAKMSRGDMSSILRVLYAAPSSSSYGSAYMQNAYPVGNPTLIVGRPYSDGAMKSILASNDDAVSMLKSLKPKIHKMHPDDAVEILSAVRIDGDRTVLIPAVKMACSLPPKTRKRLEKKIAEMADVLKASEQGRSALRSIGKSHKD